MSGYWYDGTKWSPAAVPDNGSPAGDTYRARIEASGTDYYVTLDQSAAVDSLTLGGPSAALWHSAGTLTADDLFLDGGRYILAGGTLSGATVSGTGLMISAGHGWLDGLTIDGNLTLSRREPGNNTDPTVLNGLQVTLGSTLSLADGTLLFSGDQALGGGGVISFDGFNGAGIHAKSGTLTIDTGTTLRTGTAGATLSGSEFGGWLSNRGTVVSSVKDRTVTLASHWSNEGTLRVDSNALMNAGSSTGSVWSNAGRIEVVSGTLTTGGRWTNSGVIEIGEGGTARLGGNYTTADLEGVTNAGTLIISGVLDNTGETLRIGDAFGSPTLGDTGLYTRSLGHVLGGEILAEGEGLLRVQQGRLDGVAINADVAVAPAGTLSLREGVVIGPGRSLSLGGSDPIKGGKAFLDFYGEQTLTGAGEVRFDGNEFNAITNSGTLTVGDGITIRTGTGGGDIGRGDSDLINWGTVSADTVGEMIRVLSRSVANNGTLSASNGGRLLLPGRIINNGVISAESDGVIGLSGVFDSTALGQVTNNGGRVAIVGQMENTGHTLTLNSQTGSWLLALSMTDVGTIRGGRVETTDGTKLIMPGFTTPGSSNRPLGTLDGVTLSGEIEVQRDARLALLNGVTLDEGRVNVDGNLRLSSVYGDGEIVLNDGVVDPRADSEIGAGIKLRTGSGGGSIYGGTTGSLLNRGTISAETRGERLWVTAPTTNLGTLQAVDGGVLRARLTGDAGRLILGRDSHLDLDGAYVVDQDLTVGESTTLSLGGDWDITGALSVTGGTLRIGGASDASHLAGIDFDSALIGVFGMYDNSGQTLVVDDPDRPWQLEWGGNIVGGSIVAENGGRLSVAARRSDTQGPAPATLDGVTINADIQILPGCQGLRLTGAWQNNATIYAGGTLWLDGEFAFNQLGQIRGDASVVLQGRWNGSGDTYHISDNAGFWRFSNGEIDGLTLTADESTWIGFLDSRSALLRGVTLGADVVMNHYGNTLNVEDGLTLRDDAEIRMGYSSRLIFHNSGALDGDGEIAFAGRFFGGVVQVGSDQTLTIGSDVTVRTGDQSGDINVGAGATLINEGTIHAAAPGKTLEVSAYWDTWDNTLDPSSKFQNAGVLRADAGAVLDVRFIDWTNDADIRLYGGTVKVTGDTFTNGETGSIGGVGVLDVSETDLINSGVIAAGLSPGELVIQGDLVQTAAGRIVLEVGETSDLLTILGSADLAGSLEIRLLAGAFDLGSPVIVFDAESISGAFDEVFVLGGDADVLVDGTSGRIIVSNVVPEPATVTLAMLGLVAAALQRRRLGARSLHVA